VNTEDVVAVGFSELMAKLTYLSPENRELVHQTYVFAEASHSGQLRKNGDPYITHPIAVAILCAEWELDTQTLIGALLHDTIEDCHISKTALVERFGVAVAEVVDGLTKIDKLHFSTREEGQAESFRKMLLAMSRDVRVILIKLADRLHNMRTLADMKRDSWKRIASETMHIYVPIAHRLGLNQVYRELQDLSFRYLFPWRSRIVAKAIEKMRKRRRNSIEKFSQEIHHLFVQAQIPVRVEGREKTLFSIYQKMVKNHLNFAQVTDMYGLRIILQNGSVLNCYTALGVLHQNYRPFPEKLKDYIANPKPNGYQSLHTTLITPSSVNVEFQVRTESMHEVAEAGVAAHWLYKTHGSEIVPLDQQLSPEWLQPLLDIQNETHDSTEFLEHVKIGLFPDEVYVSTPKGRIISVPRGSTVIDFAYAIHTNVGEHAVSAQINKRPVPLRTILKTGETIEIITDPAAKPQLTWLDFVRTGRARSHIRSFFKTMMQNESKALGEKLLLQALQMEGMESFFSVQHPQHDEVWSKLLHFMGSKTRNELLADIGMGKRMASIVAKRIAIFLADNDQRPDTLLLSLEHLAAVESVTHSIVLDGSENVSVQFSPCCRPIPGDFIVGYLGRGEGVTVHRHDCGTAKRLRHKDSERFIHVEWSAHPVRTFDAGIDVSAKDGKGLLARIASALTGAGADIVHLDMGQQRTHHHTSVQDVELHFVVSVRNTNHLDGVLRALNRAVSVHHAKRHQAAASQP
jgi:GTP pyrophosphokinase